VLGNKGDLDKVRAVSKEDIQEFEKKTGIKIFEVSAKTGQAVDNAFRVIVENLIQRKYLLFI
jgi:Fe2+ transport system protein B